MVEKSDSKPKAGILKAVLGFILALPIGAVLGVFGQYWITKEKARTDIVRESYIELLKIQRKNDLDLKREPDKFIDMTSLSVRDLVIHGSEPVLSALAREWDGIYHAQVRVCCGDFQQIKNSVSVIQSMRGEVMPFADHISDDKVMFLLHFCRLPASTAEAVPCSPLDER